MADGLLCILIDPMYVIDVNGKDMQFEWNDRLGPTILKKSGEPRKRRPPRESHPFWVSLGKWIAGGKKVDLNGRCVLTGDG